MMRGKLNLLIRFRGYSVLEETEEEDLIDLIALDRNADEKLLIRLSARSKLMSGNIGIHQVKEMVKATEKLGLKRGILIGKGFSQSARKEAGGNRIETLTYRSLPSFDIFKHDLVPKHEIITKDEAKTILRKYHIKPYKLPMIKRADPVARIIGAKPGDIIKITRKSPTAGVHVVYKYVV